jgi:ribonuclease PH
MRVSGPIADQLRDVSMTTGFARHAEGSCLIQMGGTEVLCTASVEHARAALPARRPGQGWVTAEYGMLPRATHTARPARGRPGQAVRRTQEIQRLIGRALRAVVDLKAMGEMSIQIDCDVLNADGGTRCASITGAWVALAWPSKHCMRMNVLSTMPLTRPGGGGQLRPVAGHPVLDLDYPEDSKADADANFVLTGARRAGGGAGHRRAAAPFRRGAAAGAACASPASAPPTCSTAQRAAHGGRLMSRRAACRPGGSCWPATMPGKLQRGRRPCWPPIGVDRRLRRRARPARCRRRPRPDFAGNARIKALAAAPASAQLPALADDSGFCVAALGGAPGVAAPARLGRAARWLARLRRRHDASGVERSWRRAHPGRLRLVRLRPGASPGPTATPRIAGRGAGRMRLRRRAAPGASATTRCSTPDGRDRDLWRD